MTTTTIKTIGTGNNSLQMFLNALRREGVNWVVDVRSKPFSWNKDFNRLNLRETLRKEGLIYEWMPSLGGLDEDVYGTENWRKAIDSLIERAQNDDKGFVVIMCSEADPMKCHRELWIGPDLRAKGVEVVHILMPIVPKKPVTTLDQFL